LLASVDKAVVVLLGDALLPARPVTLVFEARVAVAVRLVVKDLGGHRPV